MSAPTLYLLVDIELARHVLTDPEYLGVTVIRVCCKEASGAIGFEAEAKTRGILNRLIADAWGWNTKANEPISFSEGQDDWSDPFYFLANGGMGSLGLMVLCHAMNRDHLEDLREVADYCRKWLEVSANCDEEDMLGQLLLGVPRHLRSNPLIHATRHCRMVSLWNMADMSFTGLVADGETFVRGLESTCRESGVRFVQLDSRDEWPVW